MRFRNILLFRRLLGGVAHHPLRTAAAARRLFSSESPQPPPLLTLLRRYLNNPSANRNQILDKLETNSPSSALIAALRDEARQLEKLKKDSLADPGMTALVTDDLDRVHRDLETVLLDSLVTFAEEETTHPASSVLLEVSAGVGGQEAMLFAQEIHEMYLAWAEFNNWESFVLNEDTTELGGLRHSSVEITSPLALQKLLLPETGVHRVQRVPSTEKSGRVHTSTASVSVIPLINSNTSIIDLPASSLKIETKRASGAGGQHVNKTESAVRITHLPSGLVVECQSQRSQIQNKNEALRVLRSRLAAADEEKILSEKRKLRAGQVGSSGRNEKIRTYNYIQDRVTDHRGPVTSFDLRGILEGGEQFEKFNNSVRESLLTKRVEEIIRFWITRK